jgi:LPXTG-motif cell wall-anchored protein
MMDGSLSFITALIGLILSLGAFGFLYRRKQKHSNLINLVAYQSLGAKKGVAAIQVGNEILVVGVMPNGFRVLKTMSASAVVEQKADLFSEKIEKLRKLKEDTDD